MLISQKHNFVFFCMPKCASNSIELMLKPHSEIHLRGRPQVRHTNVREYRTYIQPYLADVAGTTELETICLVREPVSWLNSWYRFRARHDLRSGNHPHSTSHVDFEGFVEAYLAVPRPAFAAIGSQYEFVRDAQGETGVDRLFAYDDIPGLVDFFSKRVGRRLTLKTLNIGPGKVHASNLLERVDALKRRLAGALSGSAGMVTPKSGEIALSPELRGRLRSAISKDFEIYESLFARQENLT